MSKAYFLLTKALRAYFYFIELIIFKTKVNYKIQTNLIFSYSIILIKNYLVTIKNKKLDPFQEQEEIKRTIGNIFNANEEFTFLSILKRTEAILNTDKIKENYKESIAKNINILFKVIINFYNKIIVISAQFNSALLFFINYNIRDISLYCLAFLYSGKIFKKTLDKRELIKNISLLVTNYKVVFNSFKDIKENELYLEILDSLLRIGYKLHKMKQPNALLEIVDAIVSIADNYISKYRGAEVIETSLEIVERAAFLCIYEDSNGIFKKFLAYIKKYQWNASAHSCIEFEDKYPDITYTLGMSGSEYFINCLKILKNKLELRIIKKENDYFSDVFSPFEKKLIQEIKKDSLEKFLIELNNLPVF